MIAVVAAYPQRVRRGIIHDEAPQLSEGYSHQALIGESEHHHQVQHEHAKSHQSIKFEHFHPVPVYIKKEHSHLLEHPLEKGKSEQNLKLIHPESEHKSGGGLILEDHRLNTEHLASFPEHGGHEHAAIAEQGSYEHLSQGFEGGAGLHELQGHAEAHYQFAGDHGHGFPGGEEYKYEFLN
ncbi:hypothetical protein EVAR_69731_1 [Eumeta japonica]|uniref:Uncharacterized protein n=1 Tax=Eumeta variegata TaxID=151549 RepID=A0A4C2ABR9_EUMVA|nr:hypothetical protein EVAR_69731_1 [Eumeta japonica]